MKTQEEIQRELASMIELRAASRMLGATEAVHAADDVIMTLRWVLS